MSSLSVPSTKFALSLYNILSKDTGKDENIFFSPMSISSVLSMTLLGAKGKTADELLSGLHFSSSADHSAFADLISTFNGNEANNYILHLANRIFTRSDMTFKQEYLQSLNKYYQTDALNLNFGVDPNGSRVEINNWVEGKTDGKIKDLMPNGSINSMTAAVLVNAVYFKGDWANQFNRSKTKSGDFNVSPSKSVTVNFMSMEAKFPHNRDSANGFQLLHLPYKGEDLSMVVILPDDKFGLSELESKLSFDLLLNSIKNTRNVKVQVQLPKFKIEGSFDLSETLQNLGMKTVFTDKADLTGVTEDIPLKVSKVVHKSFIEVNEEGAEAAAATGAVMMMRSMPAPPARFVADHPFLLAIMDRRTDVLLFFGRITEPTKVELREEL